MQKGAEGRPPWRLRGAQAGAAIRRVRRIGLIACLGTALVGCAGAPPGEPLSDDQIIGTGTCPVVAMQADGNAWFAWLGQGDEPGIRLRRAAPDGQALGPSLRVDDAARSGFRSCPLLAVNEAGQAAVMWQQIELERIPVPGLNQPDSRRQPKILVQRFGPDGQANGAPLRVVDRVNRNYTDYDPVTGALAVAADGAVIVAWRETVTVTSPLPLPTVPSPSQVRVRTLTGYHQIFAATGQPRTEPMSLGSAIIPDTLSLAPRLQLRFDGLFAEHLGVAANGDYVLGFRGNDDGIWFQRFDPLGTAYTRERQRVDPRPALLSGEPVPGEAAFVVGRDGPFDVVYRVPATDPATGAEGDRLVGQGFAPDGVPLAQPFLDDLRVEGLVRNLLRPHRFGEGRRVLAWREGRLSGSLTVAPTLRAQFFEADGTAITAAFEVNQSPLPIFAEGGTPLSMDAAVDQAGNLVVVWNVNAQVRARVFAGAPE